ncbi:MAG: TIM barrel protein [Candidatus Hydrogenedens sp.]|nr:TIM barrel protein [Candidatus Hydrogenedens sp.]
MENETKFSRRAALGALSASAIAAALPARGEGDAPAAEAPAQGKFKYSACKWCYSKMSIEELAAAGAKIGLQGIDLLDVGEVPKLEGTGLVCSLANGPSPIPKGWNDPELHDKLVERSEELLPKIAAAGVERMIVFSGNRWGRSDLEGMRNCARGLRRITPLAESLGVTIVMELLNSKRDHKDYMCDHTAWGAELVQRVASDRFKLLYDIYHMQIMEGDVVATIEEHHAAIDHYHTGGVPGRHEIDERQELFYPRVCRAIADTGFTGWLAQEFIPADPDPVASLEAALKICRV